MKSTKIEKFNPIYYVDGVSVKIELLTLLSPLRRGVCSVTTVK